MITKQTLVQYLISTLKDTKLKDSTGEVVDEHSLKVIKYSAAIVDALKTNYYKLTPEQLATIIKGISPEKKQALLPINTTKRYQRPFNYIDKKQRKTKASVITEENLPADKGYTEVKEILKKAPENIRVELRNYLWWTYFANSVPLIKNYFDIHNAYFTAAQNKKLWTKILKSKEIKTSDIAVLKLITEKSNSLLEKLALPNKDKFILYFPPKYLKDLIKDQHSDPEKAKAHRNYLKSNLVDTFDEHGELIEDNLSTELKDQEKENEVQTD